MDGLESWDIAVISVAGYLAITCLVRLMNRRRSALIQELTQQVEVELKRRKDAKAQKNRQNLRDRLRRRDNRKNKEDAA